MKEPLRVLFYDFQTAYVKRAGDDEHNHNPTRLSLAQLGPGPRPQIWDVRCVIRDSVFGFVAPGVCMPPDLQGWGGLRRG